MSDDNYAAPFSALGKRKKGDKINRLKEDESKRMKVEKGMRRVALIMHYNELTFAKDTDDSTNRAAEEYTDKEYDEDKDGWEMKMKTRARIVRTNGAQRP
jgi:hypothetical protein